MRTTPAENGNVLLCTMATILIISLIGANVLFNCTTRYNASSKQVKGWKEALIAAEAGGDVGYAACRTVIGDLDAAEITAKFTSAGFAAASPAPANPTWTRTVPSFGQGGSLSADVTVDQLPEEPLTNPGASNRYYRIRSIGTARVFGLRRASMDDRMSQTTRGDSLLRKIDFLYDHFLATYGFGDAAPADAATSANGKASVAVPNPKISRRVELVATPVDAFEGAIKCLDAFYGPGAGSVVDSYSSRNQVPAGVTPFDPGSRYYFDATNPTDPNYSDARNGNVAVDAPTFSEGGPIYGDVGTNGGNVTHSGYNVSGTIDNNISFTVKAQTQPSPPSGQTWQPGTPNNINPTANAQDPKTADWFLYSNFDHVAVHALTTVDPNDGSTKPVETYVTVVVNGDVGGNGGSQLTIDKGVNLKVYFTNNFIMKASKMDNNNVDGAPGVFAWDPRSSTYVNSTNVSRVAHVQFYGVNDPVYPGQYIDTNPGGAGGSSGAVMWCTFYAPGADFYMNGNPDLFGAVVCKTFYGNGNCGFHFDKALRGLFGPPVEYRIASYVEDVR